MNIGDIMFACYHGVCAKAKIIGSHDYRGSSGTETFWIVKFLDNAMCIVGEKAVSELNLFKTKADCQRRVIVVRDCLRLSEHCEEWNSGYSAAMEEINTPMPVIAEDWCATECPHCGESFHNFEPCDDGYYTRAVFMQRCPYCGQMLDWDEV